MVSIWTNMLCFWRLIKTLHIWKATAFSLQQLVLYLGALLILLSLITWHGWRRREEETTDFNYKVEYVTKTTSEKCISKCNNKVLSAKYVVYRLFV